MGGADTKPIEDNLPVAVIDTNTSDSTKVGFKNNQLALAQGLEDSDSLKEGVAPTIVEFPQHQAIAHLRIVAIVL